MAQLKVENLSFTYPEETEKVVSDLSMEIAEGSFTVICGPSGCGKTTLLRLLKREIAPTGKVEGDIFYAGRRMEDWDERTLLESIGMVFQDPDNQIVLDEVLDEIVFAMENLNYSPFDMQKRVAEMVSFFGVNDLLHAKPSELSGGQKQLINLMSALMLRPKVLLLDEPTSQLDPVAARELLTFLERLNVEMGMTIILVEHRLEELFSIADSIYLMDEGKLILHGNSREVIASCYQEDQGHFYLYTPTISRLFLERDGRGAVKDIPLTVKEAQTWLKEASPMIKQSEPVDLMSEDQLDDVIEVKDAFFQYERDLPFVMNGLDLQIKRGEYFALVGGNGTGKTTLLKLCMGLVQPQRGSVKINGVSVAKKKVVNHLYEKVAYLPQDPKTFFIHDTIEAEMKQMIAIYDITDGEERMEDLLAYFEIVHLRNRHPYDCSGGEMQRAVLACLLLREPEILFIDEPTKGLDPFAKEKLSDKLAELHRDGLTIFLVTHDIEFAARYAERCAMLFNGNISAIGSPADLFKGNYFYTTAINRVTRSVQGWDALTLEEALEQWPNKSLSSS